MSVRVETTKKAGKSERAPSAKTMRRRGGAEKRGTLAKAKRGQGAAGGEATPSVPDRDAVLAFEQVQPELEAMPAVGLGRITVAIPAAVTIALGALPNIEARQPELRAHLPKYDYRRAGRLRTYAYAAIYAHHRASLAAQGERKLRALLVEGGPLRERMLRSAELLAHYGVLDAEVVAGIRSGNGHLDTANDLSELAMLFRGSLGKVKGQTPVTEAEIERAGELGARLLEALGQRRLGTDDSSAPRKEEEDRAKAFWLFHSVYEESRRAMAHLRWHEGDADLLVPSLFASHRRRPPSADEPSDEPVEGPTPDDVAPDPGASD